MRTKLALASLLTLITTNAMAVCPLQENATLSLNFNGTSATIKEVRALFDMRMGKIQTYAKQVGIEKLTLQSQNYSISTQNIYTQNNDGGTPGYRYNGSASYLIAPSEKGTDLLELLTQNNIQANLSVNRYNNNNCADPAATLRE